VPIEWLYKVKKAKNGLLNLQVKVKSLLVEETLAYEPSVKTSIPGERVKKKLDLIHTGTITEKAFKELNQKIEELNKKDRIEKKH